MINLQLAEKPTNNPNEIEVVDIFKTIQGEGPYAGMRAIFVRLAGCDLQCPKCDTNYTTGRRFYNEEELEMAIFAKLEFFYNPPLVVFTGGEPLRQNLSEIVTDLYWSRYLIQIETNGTYYQDLGTKATIVCCPKTPKIHPKWATGKAIDAYKYVLTAGEVDKDGLPTSSLGMPRPPARPPEHFNRNRVFVQPCDEGDEEKNKANMQAAIDSCMKHGYRLSLQQHKIVGLP